MAQIISNYFAPEDWIEKEEPIGSFFDDKPVVTDPLNGAILNFSHYRNGFWKDYHRHTCSHGILVIGGQMKADDQIYEKGSFVWDPAGYKGGHGAAPGSDCKFLFISNLPFDIEFLEEPEVPEKQDLTLTTANVYDKAGWVPMPRSTQSANASTISMKPLVKDPVTGMTINFIRFDAGTTLELPQLSVSCGLYVIDGELNAITDNHTQNWTPGTLCWQTPDSLPAKLEAKTECLALFVTNGELENI